MAQKPERPKAAQKKAAPPAAEPNAETTLQSIREQPPQPKRTDAAEREADKERQVAAFALVRDFLNLPKTDLESLLTFKLILDRDRGCSTPIEQFIVGLVNMYEHMEEKGLGLTLEYIEKDMEDLREEYAFALEETHFFAARYPLAKEVSDAE